MNLRNDVIENRLPKIQRNNTQRSKTDSLEILNY